MNLLPSVSIFFLQELWVSHFNWIPETYDAYVALGICNQVEFIILCQASIFEHTGNFLMISMTLQMMEVHHFHLKKCGYVNINLSHVSAGFQINFLCIIANWVTEILKSSSPGENDEGRYGRGGLSGGYSSSPQEILYFLSQILHFTHIFERNKTG